MVEIKQRLEFDAGHRVYRHGGKCRNAHGHRWAVILSMTRDDLDPLGMVLDFGEVKARVLTWINDKWDHGFLVFEQDKEMMMALRLIEDQKMYVLPYNPTVENLSECLLGVAQGLLHGTGVRVTKVELFETPNCSAIAVVPGAQQ